MLNYHQIPFLRILIPFVIGILLQLQLNIQPTTAFYFVLIGLLITLVFVFNKQTIFFKYLFMLCIDSVLGLVAFILTFNAHVNNDANYYGKNLQTDTLCFMAEVNDIPVTKANSVKLILSVWQVKNSSNYIPAKGEIIAYVKPYSNINNLVPGKLLLIKTRLQEIREPLNPNSFNFKQFFNDKGIYHTIFMDSLSFVELPVEAPKNLWRIGLETKHYIISSLKQNGLTKDAVSICSALITGFDAEIDKNLMESFAHSGTLHVLSVSGLHVGLIYLLLNLIFSVIDPNKRYRILQFVIVSFMLWFFALVTGFSAPVLRAVIMFNLLGIGGLFFRNRSFNQLNILFVSAFILLFANPLLIRNIGFLLSYSALFGILYFYPKISKISSPKNKIIKYVWQSAVLSVSATITTLPITLFVFHQFPIWFVLANLIIVPLIFVLLVLAFVNLLKITFISTITNAVTALLVYIISFFNSGTYAFVDYIHFNYTDAIFMSVLLILFSAVCIKRKFAYALLTLVLLITWQVIALMQSVYSKSTSELVIYNTPKTTNISIKNKQQVTHLPFDSANYNIHVKPNLINYNYPKLKADTFNYVASNNFNLFILSKPNKIPVTITSKIAYLLVTNNALPSNALLKKMNLKLILADASNNYSTFKKLEKICTKNNIRFYNIKSKGAFVTNL